MGSLVMNVHMERQQMERTTTQCYSTKTERKVVEKNRRNQMKILYSKLNSLLPKQNSKETLPLPDQIDEAVNYIKSLEAKLKQSKDKKDKLTGRKRLRECTTSYDSAATLSSNNKQPQIEVTEIGSALQLVWVGEQGNEFVFYEVIRILHEQGVDVENASFSAAGNSVFHTVQAQMRETAVGSGAARVTQRINSFINGSASELEYPPELWDYEISQEMLEF